MLLPFLIWGERKGASLIQDRIGPNRAAIPLMGGLRMFGFIHNMSDGIKLFFKESFVPAHAHKFWYFLAPMIPIIIAMLAPSVIPWFAPMTVQGPSGWVSISGQNLDADAGVLVLFALSGLSVYGVVLGSWASNSKYALLGGMRASAMMVSYEVSMGLSAAGIFLLAGSFGLTQIVEWQGSNPFLWGWALQPVGFVLFLVSLFAETGRPPFDVAEGESEIVAGYFVEYSAVRFALYYMGEYAHIVIASALVSTLFLGGYQVPFLPTETIRANLGVVGGGVLALLGLGVGAISLKIRRWARIYTTLKASDAADRAREYGFLATVSSVKAVVLLVSALAVGFLVRTTPAEVAGDLVHWPLWVNAATALVQLGVLLVKTAIICWVFIWVRWTLPRFRYDQIMSLGWKVMLNVALVNLLITALVAKLLVGGR
ncbi:MAG: NADH-quinone oxidoreductase subunit H [Fibrobacteria bacterium]|nr:NADH-quinone oxidoreductase subunit H [Fibrobacteria bacterium]